MSSTEVSVGTIARFHAEHIRPAADALRGRGVELLPPGPDPGAASYWLRRAAGTELVVRLDQKRAADALARRWEARGLPEMAALSGPLMELSEALAEGADDPQDISPFIYTIF